MAQTQRERIQDLLSADPSPQRTALLRLGFDALASEPLSAILGDAHLAPLITAALTRDNAQRMADRHVLKAIARLQQTMAQRPETVRDAMPDETRAALVALVQSGKGPRFAWLSGAIDPADLRALFAPVVQQVLSQFVAKLPIPGLGGGSQGGAGLGGLVGMLGKQVSKSASQLADVGKSVIGGLSGELEKRLGTLTRDFSQTAIGEFRTAIAERLTSDEGRDIVRRISESVVARVLETRVGTIVDDFLRIPVDDVARLVEGTVDHQRSHPLFALLLEAEISAALAEVGSRSLLELLHEANLLDDARALSIAAVEPGLKRLVQSQPFGDWLDQLLADSAVP